MLDQDGAADLLLVLTSRGYLSNSCRQYVMQLSCPCTFVVLLLLCRLVQTAC